MLIKLLPEQAASHWQDIRYAIEESLPPVVGQQSDRMQNILAAILTEDIVVWISTKTIEDKELIDGIVLTTLTLDLASGTRSLLLYVVFGYGESIANSWKNGLETLKAYAKGNKCHRIIGYTEVPSIVKFAKMMGADTRFTFVSFPVE